MGTLGKTTITDLSVYNTIHGKIEQADKVTIEPGSNDVWRNMLVTTGANDIFSVPNVYANYSLGALRAKSIYINGSANNTTAHISSDATSNMYFALSEVIPLVIDTTSTTNPIIRPSSDLNGAVNLGSSSNSWNNIYGKTLYENGTSLANKYAASSHTHSFLTGTEATPSATTRNLTDFPASKTLFTGYWGSSKGYATNYGTTLDISYSTWYQRLAFNTAGRIEYFRGINTNNSDNTSATLSKVGDLAYTSDIPTSLKNPYSLTIQANGTTIGTYDGSATVTANIPPATVSTSGVMTTTTQTFAGFKTFEGGIRIGKDDSETISSHIIVFGDGDIGSGDIYTYIQETEDDVLNIFANNGVYINTGYYGNVVINAGHSGDSNIYIGPENKTYTAQTANINITGPITEIISGQVNINSSGGGINLKGNTTISGNCYAIAFYETSDEKLKDFSGDVNVDFAKLKEIRKSYFTWKDSETGKIQIGTSAQDVQKIYPELVSEDNNGILTIDYAKLSIIALSAIDKLDERLSKIEKALNISE